MITSPNAKALQFTCFRSVDLNFSIEIELRLVLKIIVSSLVTFCCFFIISSHFLLKNYHSIIIMMQIFHFYFHYNRENGKKALCKQTFCQ